MILGVTATREGLTIAQKNALHIIFPKLSPSALLHGGAVGGDDDIDVIACNYMPGLAIEVYPSSEVRREYWLNARKLVETRKSGLRKVHPTMDPLARNVVIARKCNRLVACPAGMKETKRGGTWYSVRRARHFRKPIMIIFPNGILEEENH